MLLSVKEMEVKKIRFDEVFKPGQIDFADSEVRQVTPLHASGQAELLPNTDGEVRIQGRIEVTMEAECDRCLTGLATFPVDARFDLFYEPNSAVAGLEEIAIDEGEAEIGFYQGAGLELEDILREQVLLLLPMQRVCGGDCKGICPICGKNRNETVCHCTVAPADDRWNALRNLNI
ncbi:MAG: YceD family protein [Bryobacteraceae bacterium]